jgi:hypothetical protein
MVFVRSSAPAHPCTGAHTAPPPTPGNVRGRPSVASGGRDHHTPEPHVGGVRRNCPPCRAALHRRRNGDRCTVAAMATGAIPVPAASAAIVAESAAMVAVVAAAYGIPVSLATVAASMGTLGTLNMISRAVFVQGARAMAWFAGPAGVAGVSALGAATAAMQTSAVGRVAIAVAQNRGRALSAAHSRRVAEEARRAYTAS